MSIRVFLKRIVLLVMLFFLFDFLLSFVLIKGMNKYYGINQEPDILMNGSSMSMSGFNRADIENLTQMKVANYSHEGVSVDDRYAMINHFFRKYPVGVKTVIYEINPVLFSKIKSAENVYTIFFPYMDDSTVDKYIKQNAGTIEYFTNKIIRTKRFDSRLIRLIIIGYLGKYENIKTSTIDTAGLSPLTTQKGKAEVMMEKASIEVFENTMDLIRSHNSDIVLVMMPMYYIKLQTFNKEGYETLCKYMEDYCLTRHDVEFLNLNQDSIISNANYFSDPLHFNVYGQRYITNIIGKFLVDN